VDRVGTGDAAGPATAGDTGPAAAGEAAFELPRLRTLARHAGPSVLEGTLVPLGLFYLFVTFGGVETAMLASLAWTYLAILRRIATRQRISGLLLVGAAGVTAKTVIAVELHSTFIYFLQPSLGTAAVGLAFLASVVAGRPLAQRLAHDFVPVPESMLHRPAVRAVCVRISLLFALADLLNAAGAIGLLLTMPLTSYLAARALLSWILTGAAAGASFLLARRALGRPAAGVRPPLS
jgi:hypothetical protein